MFSTYNDLEKIILKVTGKETGPVGKRTTLRSTNTVKNLMVKLFNEIDKSDDRTALLKSVDYQLSPRYYGISGPNHPCLLMYFSDVNKWLTSKHEDKLNENIFLRKSEMLRYPEVAKYYNEISEILEAERNERKAKEKREEELRNREKAIELNQFLKENNSKVIYLYNKFYQDAISRNVHRTHSIDTNYSQSFENLKEGEIYVTSSFGIYNDRDYLEKSFGHVTVFKYLGENKATIINGIGMYGPSTWLINNVTGTMECKTGKMLPINEFLDLYQDEMKKCVEHNKIVVKENSRYEYDPNWGMN